MALRYAASPDEAREMVNDAFFQVFTKMDRYDTAQPFLPWLNTIAVRTAIDYYRKYRKNEVELTSDENIPESVTNNHIVSKLAAEELRKLVQLLPPAYRMAINLYAIEGFSHGEIATMLGITEGASKSNLFKARAKLKQMIEEQNKTNKSAQS